MRGGLRSLVLVTAAAAVLYAAQPEPAVEETRTAPALENRAATPPPKLNVVVRCAATCSYLVDQGLPDPDDLEQEVEPDDAP